MCKILEIIWNLNIDLPTTRPWRWWSCWCHLHTVIGVMNAICSTTNAATPSLIHSDTRPKVVIDTLNFHVIWVERVVFRATWAMHMAPTGSLASRGEVNAECQNDPSFRNGFDKTISFIQFHLFPVVLCKWIDNYLQLALPSLTLFWFFAAV